MNEVSLGLADNIMTIVEKLLVFKAMGSATTILAVAFATYGLLEVFMNKNIDIRVPRYLSNKEKEVLFVCSSFLAAVYGPLIAIFLMITSPAELNFVIIGLLAVITLFGYSILARKVKSLMSKQSNVTVDSIMSILQILGTNLAAMIQATLIRVLNLILEVVHGLYIQNYTVVVIILNAVLTVMMVKVMGNSSDAGQVNMIGSFVGTVVHAIYSRKKREKLKKEFDNEQDKRFTTANGNAVSK